MKHYIYIDKEILNSYISQIYGGILERGKAEKELVEKLRNAIGKEVKLYYGHDGGYIGWNSCGTYHIKDVEIIEEN